MRLFKCDGKKKIQFLTYTSHISSAQETHVSSSYCIGEHNTEYFHQDRKFSESSLSNEPTLYVRL